MSECSWSVIKQIADTGNADSCFSLGDKKQITVTTFDSRQIQTNAQIVAFNYNFKNGTTAQRAGITFWIEDLLGASNWGTAKMNYWGSQINGSLNGVFASFPQDLKNVISPAYRFVTYTNDTFNGEYASYNLWAPSITEMGMSFNSTVLTSEKSHSHVAFPYCVSNETRKKKNNGEYLDYWTCSEWNGNGYKFVVRADGSVYSGSSRSDYVFESTVSKGYCGCFCI